MTIKRKEDKEGSDAMKGEREKMKIKTNGMVGMLRLKTPPFEALL